MRKGLISNLFMIIAVLVMISTATIAILIHVNKNNTSNLFFFGYKVAVIGSDSMETQYKRGTLVIIKKANYNTIKRKDIIAFQLQSTGAIAFHRVFDVQPDGLVTKGDANGAPDGSLVTSKNLIGEEAFHTNFFIDYWNALHQPIGFLLFIVFPILGVFWLTITSKFLPFFIGWAKQTVACK